MLVYKLHYQSSIILWNHIVQCLICFIWWGVSKSFSALPFQTFLKMMLIVIQVRKKCSVVTHICIGILMDVSNTHSTPYVLWVMSLYHTSAIRGYYEHKEAHHSPQPSWKWHQPVPACWHLTEGLSHHSRWWCQPER